MIWIGTETYQEEPIIKEEFLVKIKDMTAWSPRPLATQWVWWPENRNVNRRAVHTIPKGLCPSGLACCTCHVLRFAPSSWMAASSWQHAPGRLVGPVGFCARGWGVGVPGAKALDSLIWPRNRTRRLTLTWEVWDAHFWGLELDLWPPTHRKEWN